jgi:cytochrome P450
MLSLDGAEHRRHRGPFAAPFRLAPVRERFAARVREETDALIDGFERDGAAELRTQFAGPLAAAVVADALGLRDVSVDRVLGWYAGIVGAVTALSGGADELPASGRSGFEALRAAVEPELDRDPLSSLVAAAAHADDGGLARHEVVSNAAVMLFGGIETTEGMIASALGMLLEDPGALAAVRAEPALAAAAVEESLRLEPAAATVDRYTTRAVELGGARIPAGELVIVSIAAANRDPAVFADPDRYDLHRDDTRRHVAFAAGPHVCIGMHLARLEAHTAVVRALSASPACGWTPRRRRRGRTGSCSASRPRSGSCGTDEFPDRAWS